jgi:hypothetical protein
MPVLKGFKYLNAGMREIILMLRWGKALNNDVILIALRVRGGCFLEQKLARYCCSSESRAINNPADN